MFMFLLVCFDPAYLRTQAAARMVSGCVSRFAMPSQPRWNGEGTPNQAGHGSTAARHLLEAAPPPPPDPLDTAPQPTSRVNIQASRTLSFSDRPLSCPTWFRAGCEGQGDGGKVAGGLGLVGLAVVASDKGGQGARDRRPDIKSATLCPPFSTTLNHFNSPRSDLTYTHQQLNSVQLSELWPCCIFLLNSCTMPARLHTVPM